MTPTQRAAMEQAISDFEHISAAGGRVEFVERRIAALRAALAEPEAQEPAVEPVAEVVWSKDTDYEFKFKMLVELCCKEGVPVKLYAGPFDSGGMYWHDTDTDRASPQAPQPAPAITIQRLPADDTEGGSL